MGKYGIGRGWGSAVPKVPKRSDVPAKPKTEYLVANSVGNVNSYLESGWELYGEPTIFKNTNTFAVEIYQPMIRRK